VKSPKRIEGGVVSAEDQESQERKEAGAVRCCGSERQEAQCECQQAEGCEEAGIASEVDGDGDWTNSEASEEVRLARDEIERAISHLNIELHRVAYQTGFIPTLLIEKIGRGGSLVPKLVMIDETVVEGQPLVDMRTAIASSSKHYKG